MAAVGSLAAVARLLAHYPHVANCPWCREYADEYLDTYPAHVLLIAVLDHHDSAHRNDLLGTTSAFF